MESLIQISVGKGDASQSTAGIVEQTTRIPLL